MEKTANESIVTKKEEIGNALSENLAAMMRQLGFEKSVKLLDVKEEKLASADRWR